MYRVIGMSPFVFLIWAICDFFYWSVAKSLSILLTFERTSFGSIDFLCCVLFSVLLIFAVVCHFLPFAYFGFLPSFSSFLIRSETTVARSSFRSHMSILRLWMDPEVLLCLQPTRFYMLRLLHSTIDLFTSEASWLAHYVEVCHWSCCR